MAAVLKSVALLLCLFLCGSLAQDIIFGESQPFGEAIKPMHTLTWDTTTSLFPENTNLEFVAGEPTEILLGFVNTGETVVTVESIQAFLVHPMEFSYHIQNYTRATYDVEVYPKEEVTVGYRFAPSEMLDPRSFGMYLNVHFTDDLNNNYTHAFFNETINIVEAEASVDLETFFKYCLAIGGILLIGFIAYKFKTSMQKPRKIEYGTARGNADDDSEWLAGTAADVNRRPNAKKKSKGKKK